MVHSSPHSVLTLKKIILLNIISDVKSYHPDALARLPPMVRQKLLMNVPVADMWWIEYSRVADGIDMEHVWTTILMTRMGKNILKDEYKSILYALPLPPREVYLEGLGYLILNEEMLLEGYQNHIQNFLDLVFSVRHCVGIKNWKEFLRKDPQWKLKFVTLNDDGAAIPVKKILQYYKPAVADVCLLTLLVDDCHYLPKQASILASHFVETSFWKETSYPIVLVKLRQYLLRVETLTFAALTDGTSCPVESCNQYSSALYFIVAEMLAVQRYANLREIQLQSTNAEMLTSLLGKVAPLLASKESDDYINHTPYKSLRELTLISQEKVCLDSSSPPEALLCDSISHILLSQRSLEKFLLEGINLAYPIKHLTTLPEALTKFIQRPNEKQIIFATLPISFPLFQMIFEAFLHLQSIYTQTLCFSDVTIPKATLPPTKEVKATPVIMSKWNYHSKSIKIYQTYLHPQVIFWFFDKHHKFFLHKLELDTVTTHANMSLITAIARHRHLLVEHLVLSNIKIQHCNVVAKDFQLLMTKDRLKVLSITKCNIGVSGVLQDITTALTRLYFWPGKYVQVLDLKENKLGSETDAHIRDFFVALFRLWKLQRISLDISSNGLKPHHFYNIHDIWRMYSFGEKLRQLNCKGNRMEWRQRSTVGQLARWVFV